MKKEFKLVSASVIGLVCASLMTPSFAASSVRSLGGAGTYTGTTSASQAASATKATTAARAGSIRVDGSTRVNSGSSLRTPSTRSATAPRLSIGKYLSANSSVGTGGKIDAELSTNVGNLGNSVGKLDETVTDIKGDLTILQEQVNNFDIDALRGDIQNLVDAKVVLSYDKEGGILTIEHEGHTDEVSIFDQEKADAIINNLISSELSKVQEKVAGVEEKVAGVEGKFAGVEAEIAAVKKQVGDLDIPEVPEYTAGNLIDITNNKVSAKIVGALTGALNQEEGLVTATQVVNYAIPRPGAGQCDTPSKTCVLSVKNDGQLYWLELVDTETEGNSGNGTDDPVTE
ncbi:MAG: hypothetical protein ACLRFK_02255 [Alphaproteobacteria bacterium]